MKPLTENKRLLSAMAAAAVMCLVLALVFLSPAKKGAGGGKAEDTEIEGVDLTYLSFNRDNQKKLEVKCRESQKAADGRLLMKSITATIFKADKLDQDIHVSADSGYTKDEFNDFFLQGHALITSQSFTLSANSYSLKDMSILTTQDAVDFKLRDISGRAGKGLMYVITNKYVKMFRAEGVLNRAGKAYDFQAQTLRVVEKKKLLLMDKNARVEGSGSLLKAERIVLQFDGDFANLQSAEAVGQSYFHSEEVGADGRKHDKEIRANRIRMSNDSQGRLQKIDVAGAGEISLVDGDGSGQVRSDAIEIALNSETQTVETIQALSRGTLTHRGKEKLRVEADSFLAKYSKEGALSQVQADKKCSFETDDFNGQSESIRYDVPRFTIDISGKNSSVVSGRNTFVSGQFQIHTRTRQLDSGQSVKATLIPEKKSVLLGAKPIFVTAGGMEMGEQGKSVRFTDHVSLFQEEIEMHAGELLFESPANRISCRGNADLKFVDNGEMVTLRGKTVAFDPAADKIVIEGEGRTASAPAASNSPSAATTSWTTSTPPSTSPSARRTLSARRSCCTGSMPARPYGSRTRPRSLARGPGRPADRN
jgi:lipopolysaccharide export system protein LptA